MQSNYKQIIEKYTADIKIDKKLADEVKSFLNKVISKNEEHIAFFGGNLTGVYNIHFTTMDKNELMLDIFNGVDDLALRKEIRALEYVGSSWVVATEPVTLVCLYLAHRFKKSDLSDNLKRSAMMDLAMIVHVRFITSLHSYYFPYNFPEATAIAAYTALSRKYTLKQEGTWYKTLIKRCEDFLFNQDTWQKTMNTYAPDEELIAMYSDLQLRMRSMIKNIADVSYRLHNDGVGMDQEKATISTDDGLKVRDINRLHSTYHDYFLSVAAEPRALIKSELISIVGDAVTTMPEPPLYDVLVYMSKKVNERDRQCTKLIDETLIYVFNYLQSEGIGDDALRDLAFLIEKIKSMITASRTNDKHVLEMRKLADKIVKKGCATRSASALSGLRTGIILYIVIRTFTKDHYQS